MRILTLVNSLTSINTFVYGNHIELFAKTRQAFPTMKLPFFHPHRMSIDRARNQAAIQAMEMDCDYLFFLDDDVMVPSDTIYKLLKADKDIVAGLVYIRGFPFNVMAFKIRVDEKDDKKKMLDLPEAAIMEEDRTLKLNDDGEPLTDCDAVGFSCCLIKMEVIKAMEPPYFISGTNFTEDVYFCNKARDMITPIPTISLHAGIQCGHMMPQEPIEYKTVEIFRTFYASIKALQLETIGEEAGEIIRDKEYIARCLDEL